jgi:hypothetical protein
VSATLLLKSRSDTTPRRPAQGRLGSSQKTASVPLARAQPASETLVLHCQWRMVGRRLQCVWAGDPISTAIKVMGLMSLPPV